MARANAHNTIFDAAGEPMVGAEVRVYENRDTGSPIAATMYDAPSSGNVLTWPLTTDSNGFWSFYLDTPQQVTLVISYPGKTDRTVNDVHVSIPGNEQVRQTDLTTTLTDYLTSASAASTYVAASAVVLKSLFTTAGDLLYATGSAAVARLAIGTAHQELAVNSGATAPTWVNGCRAVLTTAGDILYASAANTLARLAKGTAYQELTMNSGATAPQWSTGVLATISAAGDLLYGSAANAVARLAKGTAYQHLRMNAGATAPEWASQPTAHAYHDANQSIANGSLVAVALNSERFDNDTIHDTSTNNSRLTCKTAGKYAIFGQIMYAANAAGTRALQLKLNGSTMIAFEWRPNNGAATTAVCASTVYALAVNDYVEMIAYQDSGGDLDLNSSANYTPEFSMVWVAP